MFLNSIVVLNLGKVTIGEPEGVQRREARVVPQQLLLQKLHCVQREHQALVLQHAVNVQACLRWEEGQSALSICVKPPFPISQLSRYCLMCNVTGTEE